MSETKSTVLNGTEIVAIIRACKESSVTKFELDSLKIHFGDQEQANLSPSPTTIITYAAETAPSQDFYSEADANKAVIDEGSQMLLDPVTYEAKLLES